MIRPGPGQSMTIMELRSEKLAPGNRGLFQLTALPNRMPRLPVKKPSAGPHSAYSAGRPVAVSRCFCNVSIWPAKHIRELGDGRTSSISGIRADDFGRPC